MEFLPEQLARAQMSYRLERRSRALDAWARAEGRAERVLVRRAARRSPRRKPW